jgi:hypothetical protein
MVRIKHRARITKLCTIREPTEVNVIAHGFNVENLGNTIARISGYNPIKPKGFLIVLNYNNIEVVRDENLIVSFDDSELKAGETARNEVVIHVDRMTNFDYEF